MVRWGIVASLSAGLFCLGGCGVTTGATGSTPAPGRPVDGWTTAAGSPRAAGAPPIDRPSADPTGPTFPLTMRRTGGIAGFHDTVVLRANGTLTVDTDAIHGRTCTLNKTTRTALLVALSTLRLGGSRSGSATSTILTPTYTSSNPITITVTDVHGRPVDIDDPSLGEIRNEVTALVSDVTLTVPARTRCATPQRADDSVGMPPSWVTGSAD
ncbi:MAG: hypothetical protein L0H79_11715 [Intrasporangium sp.]|uniref:hypothetical protein n=1 Tax=Intrasporangium sp. TaxID=1925024 RepID=UPI002648C17B|nr:hypothetical protein [Intrasporangium sp.]MDN5796403.1 hypothetical protein [Intrasporangium sp.]